MKIIDRYILKAHIGPFLFGFCTVVFIFLMQFLMITLNQLLGKGLDNTLIFKLIIYNLAWMVVLAAPMGALFSTLMSFGNMSAASEITIIKSSGRGLYRLMLYPVIFGTILSISLFYFNDVILPEANHKSKILLSDIKRTKPTFILESGKFSSEIEGFTIFPRKIDSLTGVMLGVTIYDYTKNPNISIVTADTGKINFNSDYTHLLLDLSSGEVHQYVTNEIGKSKLIKFENYLIKLSASGFGFSQTDDGVSSRGQREMTIKDMQLIVDDSMLKSYQADSVFKLKAKKYLDATLYGLPIDSIIRKTPIEGFLNMNSITNRSIKKTKNLKNLKQIKDTINKVNSNIYLNDIEKEISILKNQVNSENSRAKDYKLHADQYEVEIQKKYAIPFACLIFVIVGCPLGVKTKGGNFGISAAISLGFYILYWACLIGGEKLADRGVISPFLGMWLGNMIVGTLGLLLMLKTNNENFRFFSWLKIPFSK